MAVRSVISHAPNTEETAVSLETLGKLEYSRNPITEVGNNFDSVKIIRRKNDNFDLALRKRLFYDAKPGSSHNCVGLFTFSHKIDSHFISL